MQRTLTERLEIRPPDDPECTGIRLAACMRGDTSRSDAMVYMRRERAAMERSGYMYWLCSDWPDLERLGADAPTVLLVKGEPDLSLPCVAIVGPRKPDDYAVALAAAFSSTLASLGVIVVSGGAIGIDTISHMSALDAGGHTICVLGSGFDSPHPPSNDDLFGRIGADPGSCMLSEYAPDMPANRGSFPERNRLVAALSDAVVVVQAGFGSGALITARFATQIRVPLFTVPADIHWAGSAGSNDLLGRGAVALCRPSDLGVVPALSGVPFPTVWKEPFRRPPGSGSPWFGRKMRAGHRKPSPSAASLMEIIAQRHVETGAGADADFLAASTGMTAAKIQASLLELEIAGRIGRIPGGTVVPSPGTD